MDREGGPFFQQSVFALIGYILVSYLKVAKISKKVLNELACKKWWKICQFLTLSEVTAVTERSPAQVSGLCSGDFHKVH